MVFQPLTELAALPDLFLLWEIHSDITGSLTLIFKLFSKKS